MGKVGIDCATVKKIPHSYPLMTAQTITPSPQATIKSSYNVLLEYPTTGQVSARVLGWPDCVVEAASKAEALAALQVMVTERLRDREIVSLEIAVPAPEPEHPWMQFAGMFKDDPDFDDVLKFIEEDRRQLDLEMDDDYDPDWDIFVAMVEEEQHQLHGEKNDDYSQVEIQKK